MCVVSQDPGPLCGLDATYLCLLGLENLNSTVPFLTETSLVCLTSLLKTVQYLSRQFIS